VARPSFKPTVSMRRKVAIAAGGGMTHEEISLAIGVSRPTLEKYFEHELSIGAYQKRMEVLLAMHKAAKKGSVAAARFFTQLSIKSTTPPPMPERESLLPEGKKAQANANAVTAAEGTEWQGLLHPRSIQ
jgi:hypothetical protein